jgi:hypothetical protein
MLLNSSLELCHGRIVNADQDHVKREVHRFASEGACALDSRPAVFERKIATFAPPPPPRAPGERTTATTAC